MLFTALHHPREAITLSVLLRVFLSKLYELIHRKGEVHLFDLADLLFVPVVNRDGYDFLTSKFGTDEWPTAKLTRKNGNFTRPCR